MPDLDTFMAEVNAKIKQLLNAPDVATRKQAAEWLGEAGEPTAITALAQAYKNDSDASVKQAAAYSLGMFRKLEEALNGPDADKVQKLIEDIVYKGKMGRRSRIPRKGMVKLLLGLLLSALLTGALAFLLPDVIRGIIPASGNTTTPLEQAAPTGGDRDRTTILADLRGIATRLGTDATKLRTQYQGVLTGGALNCAEIFEVFSPAALSAGEAASADLSAITQQVNDAITALGQSKAAAFDAVCQNGETRAPGDYGPLMVGLNTLNTTLTALNDALTAAGG
jgi:hypothetical protein